MDKWRFCVDQGDASLADIVGLAVAVQEIYRSYLSFAATHGPEVAASTFNSDLEQAAAKSGPQRSVQRTGVMMHVNLQPSPQYPGYLALDRCIRDVGGKPLETVSWRTRGESVSVAGVKLIGDFGGAHADRLWNDYCREFADMLHADSGQYEPLIYEFFLKRLPLLQMS